MEILVRIIRKHIRYKESISLYGITDLLDTPFVLIMIANKKQNIISTLAIFIVVLIAPCQWLGILPVLHTENVQHSRTLLEIGKDITLVYVIFSMESESEKRRREVIRSTYLQDPIFCPLKDLIAPDISTLTNCFVYYTLSLLEGITMQSQSIGMTPFPLHLIHRHTQRKTREI